MHVECDIFALFAVGRAFWMFFQDSVQIGVLGGGIRVVFSC